ncbi:phosphate ABC transporter permease PstA [Limisalsivibrio acetivorans]|uniref:phosphate ABC transporter permease PstA n=1 Tax=Limisalsivibrio acetivorans TaxID=1304888 RepID=UPI0003B2FD2D|nr:phosphate ABC transporter permease PstA [Limisalsivibrio acetivorans]
MNHHSDEHQKLLKKRYAKEKRFSMYGKVAIIVAALFLIFFFGNIISTGYKAFVQTEVLVDVTFNEKTVKIPLKAVSRENRDIATRGFLRMIPQIVEQNPDYMGTTRTMWVTAKGDVDQYMKDKPNRLKDSEKEYVDKLNDADRIRLAFNTGFFTRGDSKMPEIAGILAAAVGTIYVLIITMLLSVPLGVMTAIYLEEFAPDNRFTQLIEININNLAAIPSIIFGLLGLAIFINFFHVPRSSALVGGMTLALMTLPVIIISTRASLRAVPDSIRQGAYGVGASPWQVVAHHVLPVSLPGILTGTIIGLAQAMGETAPLLIVGMMAYIPDIPDGPLQATTVLPAQIYTWSGASLRPYVERTAAGIIVLLTVLLSLNFTAIWLRNKYDRKW